MAEYRLRTPISEDEIRKLRIGDIVYLSGRIYTARDAGHRRALQILNSGQPLPVDFKGMALYHLGPIVRKVDDKWEIVSAGPTTSARLEMYEAEFIEKTGVRVIIGKGGMGKKTAEACKKYGAVYAIFTGGAGALGAKAVEEVEGVEWLDLGMPEALWILRVKDFGPLTITIDAEGRNFYEEMKEKVSENLKKAYEILGVQ